MGEVELHHEKILSFLFLTRSDMLLHSLSATLFSHMQKTGFSHDLDNV